MHDKEKAAVYIRMEQLKLTLNSILLAKIDDAEGDATLQLAKFLQTELSCDSSIFRLPAHLEKYDAQSFHSYSPFHSETNLFNRKVIRPVGSFSSLGSAIRTGISNGSPLSAMSTSDADRPTSGAWRCAINRNNLRAPILSELSSSLSDNGDIANNGGSSSSERNSSEDSYSLFAAPLNVPVLQEEKAADSTNEQAEQPKPMKPLTLKEINEKLSCGHKRIFLPGRGWVSAKRLLEEMKAGILMKNYDKALQKYQFAKDNEKESCVIDLPPTPPSDGASSCNDFSPPKTQPLVSFPSHSLSGNKYSDSISDHAMFESWNPGYSMKCQF